MRPRPRHLIIAALAVACCYVAAPALSAQPYLPEAVDFEQALPAVDPVTLAGPAHGRDAHSSHDQQAGARGAHLGEGPVSFRTAVVVAPETFDLVGLAGELRPVELRARPEGGNWSRWTVAANGDPVYFGGAAELQLRTRGWRPSGTLHYVNVSGTTSELGALLNGARRTINSAFISASGVLATEAEAAPARPEIISRGTWGANRVDGGCKPRTSPERGRVKAAAVHHTVTPTKYPESQAAAIVLGICRYHRNANGWNDIGYNALVDRFGNVYAGRAGGLSLPVVGAHAQGFNAQTTGVAVIGTHTETPVTPATREGLVSYLAWKLAVHRLRATGKTTMVSAGGAASRFSEGRLVRTNRVIGHGTVGLTACPGEAIESVIPKLRREIQARLDESGGVEPPTTPPIVPPEAGGTAPRSG